MALPNRLTLVGMSGSGKSKWSEQLEQRGYKRFGCDDMIRQQLTSELMSPDRRRRSLGQWLGFPWEAGYSARQRRYLACEIAVLKQVIETLETPSYTHAPVVIDTTGSAIYTGSEVIDALKQASVVVHLVSPPNVQHEMLARYLKNRRPVLWQNHFRPRPHEDLQHALKRCYPLLLQDREKRYAQMAHVSIDFHRRHQHTYDTDSLLADIVSQMTTSHYHRFCRC